MADPPALRVPRQPKAQKPNAIMRLFCCCCLKSGANRFKRFDDEPSAEFRQRMERAQSALDMNERRKSAMPSDAAATDAVADIVPVPNADELATDTAAIGGGSGDSSAAAPADR